MHSQNIGFIFIDFRVPRCRTHQICIIASLKYTRTTSWKNNAFGCPWTQESCMRLQIQKLHLGQPDSCTNFFTAYIWTSYLLKIFYQSVCYVCFKFQLKTAKSKVLMIRFWPTIKLSMIRSLQLNKHKTITTCIPLVLFFYLFRFNERYPLQTEATFTKGAISLSCI